MPYAGSLGTLRCYFISHGDLRTGIDEEELVDSGKCWLQGPGICEITDKDLDAIAETRPRFLRVAHKDSRPVAMLK
jgi:hypothetical protein